MDQEEEWHSPQFQSIFVKEETNLEENEKDRELLPFESLIVKEETIENTEEYDDVRKECEDFDDVENSVTIKKQMDIKKEEKLFPFESVFVKEEQAEEEIFGYDDERKIENDLNNSVSFSGVFEDALTNVTGDVAQRMRARFHSILLRRGPCSTSSIPGVASSLASASAELNTTSTSIEVNRTSTKHTCGSAKLNPAFPELNSPSCVTLNHPSTMLKDPSTLLHPPSPMPDSPSIMLNHTLAVSNRPPVMLNPPLAMVNPPIGMLNSTSTVLNPSFPMPNPIFPVLNPAVKPVVNLAANPLLNPALPVLNPSVFNPALNPALNPAIILAPSSGLVQTRRPRGEPYHCKHCGIVFDNEQIMWMHEFGCKENVAASSASKYCFIVYTDYIKIYK